MKASGRPPLYRRVREIIESTRAGAARSVNTTQVVAYWLIGREIVEEAQSGKAKAGYGENLMRDLASKLTEEFGDGYGLTNLEMIRKFYVTYRELAAFANGHALRDQSDAWVDPLRGQERRCGQVHPGVESAEENIHQPL